MAGPICSIPLLASWIAACSAPAPVATGYVEGEYVLIAPVTVAQIDEVPVRRGDRVEAGMVVTRMERRDAEIAFAQAEAVLARAKSELANLKEARRNEEIRVIEAELASARAEAADAARGAQRMSDLFARGTVSQSVVDDARTRLDVAEARVAEVEANLSVAYLPARVQVIAAAVASVDVAESSRNAAAWQLEKRDLTAPASGIVFEVFRRAGEIAGPQAPVLSLLPDGAVLLRLYVPETEIARIKLGSLLDVGCDGCPEDTSATVTFVADSPEFTPPVIYSIENRQKLVYLVEARPDAHSTVLKPGQIVDVRVADVP
jgi:HlyD family secretion protein